MLHLTLESLHRRGPHRSHRLIDVTLLGCPLLAILRVSTPSHSRLDAAQKRAERDPKVAVCSNRLRCGSFSALIAIAVAIAASAMRCSERI